MATTKSARKFTSERVNLSLSREERTALQIIGKREDREPTYVAAWFVRWGIERYRKMGISFTDLKSYDWDDIDLLVRRRSQERLELRKKAEQEEIIPAELQQAMRERDRTIEKRSRVPKVERARAARASS